MSNLRLFGIDEAGVIRRIHHRIAQDLTTTEPVSAAELSAIRSGLGLAGGLISGSGLNQSILNVKDFGAVGNGIADDTLIIQSVLDIAASGGRVLIPSGTFKITSSLFVQSGVTIEGHGYSSVIKGVGNFRPVVTEGTAEARVNNVALRAFRIQCTSGSSNQSGLRFAYADDCTYQHIVIDSPAEDGIEIASCNRVDGLNCSILTPGVFGHFYYDSQDCTDTDFYIYRTGSFGHEFKDSKRCVSTRVRVIEPGDYGLATWTGFSTGPEVPGTKATEDCGWIDPYVKGGPGSNFLLYINAARRIFVRGGVFIQDPAAPAAVSIGGNFFYNEGQAITATITSGVAQLTGISDPGNQLKAGARIHIAGVTGNFTLVAAPSAGTVALVETPTQSAIGALVGFVCNPNDIVLEDVTIFGAGVDATTNTDNIDVGGDAGDPLKRIIFKNVRSQGAKRYSLNVTYATLHIEQGYFIDSLGTQEINVDAGADVEAENVEITTTVLGNYGVIARNGGIFRETNCIFEGFQVAAVSSGADGDIVHLKGGEMRNGKGLAAVLRSNCSMLGVRCKNNRNGAAGFDGQVQMFGSGSSVVGCFFDKGSSTALDSHIHEQPGATGNIYAGNSYVGGLPNNVILASGSTSSRYSQDGVILPSMTKAQRNALNPQNGWMINQSDNTPGVRIYDNGAWVKPTTVADP